MYHAVNNNNNHNVWLFWGLVLHCFPLLPLLARVLKGAPQGGGATTAQNPAAARCQPTW
jgi:hypothetical protein